MVKRTPAQQKKHYAEYQGKPEQIAKRALRNKARSMMTKKLGKAAVAGKDVDHKQGLRKGGSNAMSNLRLRSVKSNRGDTH
jgi:hypothetical protein